MNQSLNGAWQAPHLEQIADVPHPSTFAKVVIDQITDWMPSDDATPIPKSKEMSVRCCVAEQVIIDDYEMEQTRTPMIMHQFYSAKDKRWNADVATSAIRASNYMTVRTQDRVTPGLKDRFGTAIAAYEKRLVRDSRPLPIALAADKIYPVVVNACICCEVDTVNALALADRATLGKVEGHLRKFGQQKMADNMKRFQEIARAKLESLGVAFEDTKPAKKTAA